MAGGGSTNQIITLAALGIGGYLLWTNRGEIQAALDSLVAGGGGGGGAGELAPPEDGGGAEAEAPSGGGGKTDVSGKGSCACSNGKCKGDCPAGGLDPQQMIADISRKARGGASSDMAQYGFDELDMELFGDFPADQFNSFYTELDPWSGYRDARQKYTSIYKRNKRYNRYYVPRLFSS